MIEKYKEIVGAVDENGNSCFLDMEETTPTGIDMTAALGVRVQSTGRQTKKVVSYSGQDSIDPTRSLDHEERIVRYQRSMDTKKAKDCMHVSRSINNKCEVKNILVDNGTKKHLIDNIARVKLKRDRTGSRGSSDPLAKTHAHMYNSKRYYGAPGSSTSEDLFEVNAYRGGAKEAENTWRPANNEVQRRVARSGYKKMSYLETIPYDKVCKAYLVCHFKR